MHTFITARRWRVLLLVFALAAGVRLAWLGVQYTDELRSFQSGDYTLYRIGAEHIEQYGDLSNSLFLLRPPLFSGLVLLAGLDDLVVLVINALIGAALAPLSVILARQLGLRAALAAWVGVIVALDPASVVYAVWLGPESLANVTCVGMMIALLHAVTRPARGPALLWGGVAGLALVLSTLARPTPYLIWTGLAVWLVLAYRSRWAAVAVYVLVSVVGIGAWVVHNGQTFDNYTVTNIGTYNLLYYRAASVEHWATGDDLPTVYTRLASRVEERMGRDPAAADENTRHTHYTGPAAHTRAMQRTAFETFTTHPLWYVLVTPVGFARMFGWTGQLPGWSRVLEIPWNAALLFAALAGLWLAYRARHWRLFWAVLLVCGYFTAATLFVQTSGLDTRMRTMITPLMVIAAVYALDALRARRQGASSPAPEQSAPASR